MAARPFHWLVLFFPLFATALLCWLGFNTNVEKMLALFLPVVWGIMLALGGGMVFLKRYNFDQLPDGKFDEELSKLIIVLAVILMFHTLFFLIASSLYPAKDFLLSMLPNRLILYKGCLSRLYKSFLFSLIFLPSITSILVGGWSLYLVMNEKAK